MPNLMNAIDLKWAKREAKDAKIVRYLDFIVDGQSLKQLYGEDAMSMVSPIGYGPPSYQETVYKELSLQQPSIVNSGNVMIYVCPSCGDIACGSITAKITKEGDHIIWSNFAYENNYESPVYEAYQHIQPLVFETKSYLNLLKTTFISLKYD
ncbi:MAG: hypothetical protein GY810_12280 [Aureispira sp.]|nr:hypothetical protein [Aureispira sp.]